MTNTLPDFSKAHLPTESFRWRTRQNERLAPKHMRTGHLFNTVSMIWNHVMPDDAATHNFNQYAFGPTYTHQYLTQAIVAMLPELLSRDLTTFQKERLLFMYRYLNKNGIRLPEPRKELISHGSF